MHFLKKCVIVNICMAGFFLFCQLGCSNKNNTPPTINLNKKKDSIELRIVKRNEFKRLDKLMHASIYSDTLRSLPVCLLVKNNTKENIYLQLLYNDLLFSQYFLYHMTGSGWEADRQEFFTSTTHYRTVKPGDSSLVPTIIYDQPGADSIKLDFPFFYKSMQEDNYKSINVKLPFN